MTKTKYLLPFIVVILLHGSLFAQDRISRMMKRVSSDGPVLGPGRKYSENTLCYGIFPGANAPYKNAILVRTTIARTVLQDKFLSEPGLEVGVATSANNDWLGKAGVAYPATVKKVTNGLVWGVDYCISRIVMNKDNSALTVGVSVGWRGIFAGAVALNSGKGVDIPTVGMFNAGVKTKFYISRKVLLFAEYSKCLQNKFVNSDVTPKVTGPLNGDIIKAGIGLSLCFSRRD